MQKYYVIIICLVILLSACAREKPALKIGLNADYPPFEYRQEGVLTGIDIELARKIGTSLGYRIEFVEMEFDELFPALDKGKIDLVISAVTINQRRKQMVDFSIPYFCADQAILAHADGDFTIEDLPDLANYKIGVQNATTGQFFLQYNLVEEDIIPWQNIVPFTNNNLAISALINGEIDLLIMDDSAAVSFSRIKPLKIVHIIKTDEEYGIALPKNSKLKKDIDIALRQILDSDFWISLITEYMGG